VVVESSTLNDVMSACVKRRPDKWPLGLHLQVLQIVNSAQLPVPTALTQLAQISDFDLFVTSTFDPMMERALTGSGTPLEVRSYQGLQDNDIEDLQKSRDQGRRFLYYLFGKAMRGGSYDFAMCDVELLRLLVKLQDATYRPRQLFDELRQKHLLLLGINFSDWLARFFLWLAKGRGNESDVNRKLREYLADKRAGQDRSLVLFLEHFSFTTQVFPVEPERFVAELHQRWSEDTPAVSPRPQSAARQLSAEMPESGIFLSYSRSDQAAVETLYANLTRESIPVWYDAAELGPGDLWKDTIRNYINRCKVFIPVVSSEALRWGKSEFRAEWKQAVELDAQRFGMSETGIVPIVIDEGRTIFETLKASQSVPGLPDEFSRAQMYHCPAGKPAPGPQGHQQWLNLINRLRGLLQAKRS